MLSQLSKSHHFVFLHIYNQNCLPYHILSMIVLHFIHAFTSCVHFKYSIKSNVMSFYEDVSVC